jgi:hypothetical protein
LAIFKHQRKFRQQKSIEIFALKIDKYLMNKSAFEKILKNKGFPSSFFMRNRGRKK